MSETNPEAASDDPGLRPSAHACDPSQMLARRLGIAVHVSALRMRVRRLMAEHPSPGAACLEDWLLDVAHARGVRSVTRCDLAPDGFEPPPAADLSNEDLVAAICQPQNLDRPQILRAAAELISRGATDSAGVVAAALRERADRILAELARQALRVEPGHPAWTAIRAALGASRPLRSPLLHWTRIAFPVPDERGVCGRRWRLVA